MSDLPSIEQLLAGVTHASASDLHLKVSTPPVVRIDGHLRITDYPSLEAVDVERYLARLIPDRLLGQFKEHSEADFAFSHETLGRFRVNAFRQRGTVTIAIRAVTQPDKDFEQLGLPPALNGLCAEPRGLILVTGPTGSGKSTTLAAMIDRINATRRVNIITIEDPIEVEHTDKLSLISQREVGSDTGSFGEALRRVLRQDPDVILIGEMRDADTIDAALKAAETGHLVLSTLHTLDAAETINRILDSFTADHQAQVRALLAGTLRAIVSQRLVRGANGGRMPAVEILINTERATERIADAGLTATLPEVIAEGEYYGMQTFDQSLLQLFGQGEISFEEAMMVSTKPADLKLRAQQLGLISTK